MGDNGRARSPASGGEERPARPPTAASASAADASVSPASNAPSTGSSEAVPASTGSSRLDVLEPSEPTRSTPTAQLPPRHEKTHSFADRKRRKNGSYRTPQTPEPTSTLPSGSLEPEKPLLSDSQWEQEIAGFGSVLNDVLHCVTNRELVAKTAEYMATFPQHSLRFQIKMKQRANTDGSRGFQAKLMLFYVLHEFLKSFNGERLDQIQREWFQTVDEIVNACAREIRYGDKRNLEENRRRVFKTLARWEELKLYPKKVKAWKGLVMGETKPRRPPAPLPRGETERLAEAPDQLQQFELPPPSQPQLQLDRSNCPLVFERYIPNKSEEKQHWRYTAIAFIDILSRCLGLNSDISLTACIFFHRVFDRGIYAQERYKFAAACLFLSAKASSKRMKLLRMVRIMYDILETPLFAGDEELLEIERLQLLYYEMEVLQGIKFELTTEMPFFYLRRLLEEMPEKFRKAVNEDSQTVLEELFFLPVCVDIPPQLLAEAAAYIATWNKGKDFNFKWCKPSQEGYVFNERTAKDALRSYRSLVKWKRTQQSHFDALVKTVDSTSSDDDKLKLKVAFKSQIGGLRIDPSTLRNDAEFTEKAQEDTKNWVRTTKKHNSIGSSHRDYRDARGEHSASNSESRKKRGEDDVRIKDEPRSYDDSYRYDDRERGRKRDKNLGRYGPRDRSRSRSDSNSRYGRNSNGGGDRHSRDPDRYADYYEYYEDGDRYRERRRDDRYDSRERSSNYDREERGYDRREREDRGYDRRDSRDIEYRRDPSYFDRRDRSKSSRGGGDYQYGSRSGSRSRSPSRSPRESSRSGKKRKRNYRSRDRSESRSSSRSASREHGSSNSQYYRSDSRKEPSPMYSKNKRGNKGNKRKQASRRDEMPHIKQESSAA